MIVELIEPKGKSLKNLQEYIARLSSVVRDKSPKSAEKLWSRLLTESIGDEASRVFEYIPCKITKYNLDEKIRPQLFGFREGKTYYTNARELFSWGWSIEEILKTVDFTNYTVLKCETPYFIYGQISTHNQLTTVSHSQRYADCDRGYWKPEELDKMSQESWNNKVNTFRPKELTELMKKHGVVRKEVFDRGRDMLQNRVFAIGGYTNNPNAWEHFMKQRLDSHTQKETREFVEHGIGEFIHHEKYDEG
jgi:thymidylate synthase ThyX